MKRAVFYILLILGVITGCSGPKHVDTNYYQLTPSKSEMTYEKHVSMVIGPIQIPEALKRKAIVSYRKNQTQLVIPNTEYWAADLRELILDTVELNLQFSLPESEIVSFTLTQSAQPKLSLAIQLYEFGGVLGERAKLGASWQISDSKNKILVQNKSEHSKELDNGSYSAYVTALSELTGSLSDDIAKALEDMN